MTDSTLRQPRGLVLLNGTPAPYGFVELEVDSNTFYTADTFRATLPLCGNNKDDYLAQIAYWSAVNPVQVELLAGFPPDPVNFSRNDLQSLIVGNADEVNIDFFRNRVELYGRDLTSVFLDTKTVDKFQNKTSSDIALTLAQRHGLQAQIVQTTTPAGTYYTQDHVNLNDDRPEWELLTYLAQKEGYDVFVQGTTLYFQPKNDTVGNPYFVTLDYPTSDAPTWHSNAKSVQVKRNLTIARDVEVIVRSWHQYQATRFTVKSSISKTKNALNPRNTAKLPTQVYTYTIPNLTQEQAQQRANEIAQQISQHEVNLDVVLPGDTKLTARQKIQLTGTGTLFDQVFYPDSVVRRLSYDEGYTMTVHAKNHNPESTVVV